MNNTISENLFNTLGIIIFCIASVFLIRSLTNISNMADALNHNEGMVYEGAAPVKEPVITYEALVAALMCDYLEYDILIDGQLIEKEDYTMKKINDINLKRSVCYKRSYDYSDDGRLLRVVFTGCDAL